MISKDDTIQDVIAKLETMQTELNDIQTYIKENGLGSFPYECVDDAYANIEFLIESLEEVIEIQSDDQE